ncbi:MAG TPA: hypothetical protein VGM92_11975, partial [Candidatus Kapabacteria bacterium]
MKALIYTIAIDSPRETHHQLMAKILINSIIRSSFSGEVLAFTNARHRLYECGRRRVREISLDFEGENARDVESFAKTFKYRARAYMNAKRYDRVMFVDCDCLFLANPASLFASEADLMYSEETWSSLKGDWHRGYLTDEEMQAPHSPGINSGVWWVRGECYDELMIEWEGVKSGIERQQ